MTIAVGVEKRHEELEVCLLPIVRRGRHQEKIARAAAEQLAEPIPLRFLYLAAEVGSGHPVRLVADHEVPLWRGL